MRGSASALFLRKLRVRVYLLCPVVVGAGSGLAGGLSDLPAVALRMERMGGEPSAKGPLLGGEVLRHGAATSVAASCPRET
jgi:hypothetical protein